MPSLQIDDLGLAFHWGALEAYSNNACLEEPGDFNLRLPLGPLGLLVLGWDAWVGWDWYVLTPEEAQASVASLQRVRQLINDPDSWWHMEPTEEELVEIEVALAHLEGVE